MTARNKGTALTCWVGFQPFPSGETVGLARLGGRLRTTPSLAPRWGWSLPGVCCYAPKNSSTTTHAEIYMPRHMDTHACCQRHGSVQYVRRARCWAAEHSLLWRSHMEYVLYTSIDSIYGPIYCISRHLCMQEKLHTYTNAYQQQTGK